MRQPAAPDSWCRRENLAAYIRRGTPSPGPTRPLALVSLMGTPGARPVPSDHPRADAPVHMSTPAARQRLHRDRRFALWCGGKLPQLHFERVEVDRLGEDFAGTEVASTAAALVVAIG